MSTGGFRKKNAGIGTPIPAARFNCWPGGRWQRESSSLLMTNSSKAVRIFCVPTAGLVIDHLWSEVEASKSDPESIKKSPARSDPSGTQHDYDMRFQFTAAPAPANVGAVIVRLSKPCRVLFHSWFAVPASYEETRKAILPFTWVSIRQPYLAGKDQKANRLPLNLVRSARSSRSPSRPTALPTSCHPRL